MIAPRAFVPVTALLLAVSVAHAQQPKLEPLPAPSTTPPPPPPSSSTPPPSGSDFGVPDDGGAPPPPAPLPIANETRDAPPAIPAETTRNVFRPSFKGAAGFQYAQVHGVPITGARLRLGVGAQNDSSAHYASINILYGGTTEGLTAWDLRVAWNADLLRTSILRLGIDLEMGYLVIRRATIDSHIWGLGMGAGVHAAVDLYSFGPHDDHAFYLEGKLDAHLHFGAAFVWGPSILAGFRY